MNTLDELIAFCKEEEPVGALLLSGEWGCGKTYLIEHEFKEKVKDTTVVLRISLFGMMKIEEIHNAIKHAWLEEYCKLKGFSSVFDIVTKGKKILNKMGFISDAIKGVANTEFLDLVPIKNKMEDKSVVLVFDDLERCNINIVDVLGLINDYCENLKYHTIIIANQEKIVKLKKPFELTAEVQYAANSNNATGDKQNATIVINGFENNEISYTEIKEKIIQRTVQYQPDYSEIISNVIDNLKCGDEEYRAFISDNKSVLLDLFAPDELSKINSNEEKRPHNIRSLRCAINDFYRVYCVLRENEFENIQYWLHSFVAYVISYKADIAKEGRYGTLFLDERVHKLYPAFKNGYIFSAVAKWILHGVWDDDAISFEIDARKKRQEVKRPSEVLKYNRIMDVEEEIVAEGFDEFLNEVYQGELSLDEYVLFIENSCWARKYKFEFPKDLDWDKVNDGIDTRIEKLKEETPAGELLYRIIGENTKSYFDQKECQAYEKIYSFALKGIMYYKNRLLYLELLKNKPQTALMIIQNKRINLFDEEMGIETAKAYERLSNMDKIDFYAAFKNVWIANINTIDFDKAIGKNGFVKLKECLVSLKGEYEQRKKTFSIIHTQNLIDIIDELINLL